jgi:uncharacterized protein (TIGR02246 family)
VPKRQKEKDAEKLGPWGYRKTAPYSSTTILNPVRRFIKTYSTVTLVGLAIGFAVQTLAQQKVAIDPKTDQQIRAFCAKFDQTFNTNNAAAVAALYAEEAIHVTGNGTFHGRQAIENDYAKHAFGTYHSHGYYTSINRVTAMGHEVHLFGTWSCAFKDDALLNISKVTTRGF